MVSYPSSHPEAKARLCASLHSGGIGPLYMSIHDETREAFALVSLVLASSGAMRRARRVHLSSDVARAGQTSWQTDRHARSEAGKSCENAPIR